MKIVIRLQLVSVVRETVLVGSGISRVCFRGLDGGGDVWPVYDPRDVVVGWDYTVYKPGCLAEVNVMGFSGHKGVVRAAGAIVRVIPVEDVVDVRAWLNGDEKAVKINVDKKPAS